jgi:hypothetical protein
MPAVLGYTPTGRALVRITRSNNVLCSRASRVRSGRMVFARAGDEVRVSTLLVVTVPYLTHFWHHVNIIALTPSQRM